MDDRTITELWKLLNNRLAAAQNTSDQKNVLVVADKSSDFNDLEGFVSRSSDATTAKIVNVQDLDNATAESPLYDAILSGIAGDCGTAFDLDLLSAYTARLAAGGTLLVKTKVGTEDKLAKQLKMCGFLDVTVSDTNPGIVVGNTTAFKVGSSDKVTLNPETKENVISAWKLDDKNSETISEDDLLEADDLTKPDSSSLRVCATTKKAKACKDCSCGLAEELEAANRPKDTAKPDTSNAKSSCGSCYLGDAFRCASCPYLGMPAFRPGEKVQLAGNLLQDDF